MSESVLLREDVDRVAILTINRPEKYNAPEKNNRRGQRKPAMRLKKKQCVQKKRRRCAQKHLAMRIRKIRKKKNTKHL